MPSSARALSAASDDAIVKSISCGIASAADNASDTCVPPEVVAVIEELNRLQARVRLEKQSRATAHEARVLLRMTKQNVSARTAELGLVFHGFSIRRPRRRKARDSVGDLVVRSCYGGIVYATNE